VFVDELPLTATGKVVRREVRDRLLKLAAGAP
jgi:acyl-coenzyme A synthetase/AMP-(fatty) acid ligase